MLTCDVLGTSLRSPSNSSSLDAKNICAGTKSQPPPIEHLTSNMLHSCVLHTPVAGDATWPQQAHEGTVTSSSGSHGFFPVQRQHHVLCFNLCYVHTTTPHSVAQLPRFHSPYHAGPLFFCSPKAVSYEINMQGYCTVVFGPATCSTLLHTRQISHLWAGAHLPGCSVGAQCAAGAGKGAYQCQSRPG